MCAACALPGAHVLTHWSARHVHASWVPPTYACAAPVFYIVLSLLATPGPDVGSKLNTGLFMIGPMVMGLLLGGLLVSCCTRPLSCGVSAV